MEDAGWWGLTPVPAASTAEEPLAAEEGRFIGGPLLVT